MTTNHDHEIKFKRLNNLKDPAANRTWITNIINICRSRKVHEIVEGSKEERGMLVYLLKARVFPTLESEIPDGDEAVPYGTVSETGTEYWGAELTAEMETLLWGICYAALSDTMRETMSEKFDHELRGGGPPKGTPLLRLVNEKTTMLDPKAQDRAAKKEYQDHIATAMPEPLDTAGMDAWLDRAVTLNARRTTPDDEHEIIEAAIQKFPADLVDKIEAKTEATKNAEEDLDIARACWATVIERTGLRTKAREAERAMAAAAANGDARIAALEARLAAAELRATRAETAAAAAAAESAATARLRPRPSAGHPFHPKCGAYHPGGDDQCWMIHMNLVPSHMTHMYAGLHAKRANPPDGSAPLPDLTAQFPIPEAARVCVECGDPAAAVARAASAVGTDVRGSTRSTSPTSLAGADEGDAILLQLPGGHYTLAVRTESAFATKVVNTAEALSGPRAAEVRAAVDSEMGGHLERHETFTLIPITDKPVEAQLIDLKLIISEKTGALGEFIKDKARLVARGDQEWGGDVGGQDVCCTHSRAFLNSNTLGG